MDYASSSSSPVAYTDTNVTEGDKVRIIVNNAKDCEVLTVAVMERPEMGGGFEDTNLNIHFTGTTVTATWTGTNQPSLDNIITRIENEIKAMGYDGVTVTRSYTGTQLVYNFTPYRLIGGVEVPAGNTYEYNTVTGLSKELMIKVNGTDVKVTSDMTVEDAFGGTTNNHVLDKNNQEIVNPSTTPVVDGEEYTDGNIKVTGSNGVDYGEPGDDVDDTIFVGTYLADGDKKVGQTGVVAVKDVTFGAADADYTTGAQTDGYVLFQRDDEQFVRKIGSSVGTGTGSFIRKDGVIVMNPANITLEKDTVIETGYEELTLTTTELDVEGISYKWENIVTDGTDSYAKVGGTNTISCVVTFTNYTAGADDILRGDQASAGDTTSKITKAFTSTDGSSPTIATVTADPGDVQFVQDVTYSGEVTFTWTPTAGNLTFEVTWENT